MDNLLAERFGETLADKMSLADIKAMLDRLNEQELYNFLVALIDGGVPSSGCLCKEYNECKLGLSGHSPTDWFLGLKMSHTNIRIETFGSEESLKSFILMLFESARHEQ
ncbi:hypothetical protein SAMN02910339_02449 [Lachnospiraceae bacterium YSD2013]|nr:hypothetical protein SAMN02910339_02449 [Lachnospiraceae bacterium YSD2013]